MSTSKRKGGAQKAREKNIQMREKEAALCKPIDQMFKRPKLSSDADVVQFNQVDDEDYAGCSNIHIPVVTSAECESQVG